MEEVKKKIKENRVLFKKDVEPEIKSIIFQMLQMIPKMRPSVKDLLKNRFIKEIRNRIDDKFFSRNGQVKKEISSNFPETCINAFEPNKLEELLPINGTSAQNKQKDYFKQNNNSTGKSVMSKPLKLNKKLSKDLTKQFLKTKSSKYLQNSLQNVPEKGNKLFSSSRQIKRLQQVNPSSSKLNQSFGDVLWNRKLNNIRHVESKKLFQSVNTHVFEKKVKCPTEPSSKLKGKGAVLENTHDPLFEINQALFSKKKGMKVEVIPENQVLNDSMKVFQKQNEKVNKRLKNGCQGISKKKKIISSVFPKEEAKKGKSKENKEAKLGEIKQKSEVIPSSICNLKRLLKKGKEDKATKSKKEFVLNLKNFDSSKKDSKLNYMSYCLKPSKVAEKSTFHNESLHLKPKAKISSHIDNSFKNEKVNRVHYQSFALPRKKTKNEKSVHFIKSKVRREPQTHVKSHSFNEASIKSRLILRRKESINDLKKKISNRHIELNAAKPSTTNTSLNRRIVSRKKQNKGQLNHLLPTLKRNHSTAHGLIPKITNLTNSVNKNTVFQKSQKNPVQGFNEKGLVENHLPAKNVFQLSRNKDKGVSMNSFSYSHRVENLNPKVLFSKLKGHSHRNFSISKHNVIDNSTNFKKMYQSVNNS